MQYIYIASRNNTNDFKTSLKLRTMLVGKKWDALLPINGHIKVERQLINKRFMAQFHSCISYENFTTPGKILISISFKKILLASAYAPSYNIVNNFMTLRHYTLSDHTWYALTHDFSEQLRTEQGQAYLRVPSLKPLNTFRWITF